MKSENRRAMWAVCVTIVVAFVVGVFAANSLDDLNVVGASSLRGAVTFYGANVFASSTSFSGDLDLNDILDLDAADDSYYGANVYNSGNGGGLYLNSGGTGDIIHIEDAGTEVFTIEDGCAAVSTTWDPANLADGAQESKDVTVTGAALGDIAICGAGVDVTDLLVSCTVTAADTATIVIANETGGAIDLASSTWYVTVIKTH